MYKKGITLVELIIVIVIMGIITAFTVPAVKHYLETAQQKADEHNIEVLEDIITTALADGTLVLLDNKLYNTETERSYSGTGSYFRNDMKEYINSRVFPMIEDARNEYNYAKAYDDYKFLFKVDKEILYIIYYNSEHEEVVLTSIDTTNLEVLV